MLAGRSFRKWIQELTLSLNSTKSACGFCYLSRDCQEYRELQRRARDGAPRSDKFKKIRHLVGRLNHTMKAVAIIVASSLVLQHLFDDPQLRRAPSSTSSQPPLQERNPSLSAIAGRMVDSDKVDGFRAALQHMDHSYGLSKALKDKCSDKNWKPRVHAELILLNLFWTRDFEFVSGDKFIGCSKPACYCCYQYVQAHPGTWVPPACHNNHWLNWKPPDIFDRNRQDEIKLRERILNDMNKKIRNEVCQQIHERRAPARWQPDSHTEISTRASEHAGFSTAIDALHSGLDDIYSEQEPDSDSASYSDRSDMAQGEERFEEGSKPEDVHVEFRDSDSDNADDSERSDMFQNEGRFEESTISEDVQVDVRNLKAEGGKDNSIDLIDEDEIKDEDESEDEDDGGGALL